MVEVAIVFPLLVLVALALVEFAIYYHAHNVVETAVQEGARLASRREGSFGEGRDRALAIIHAGLNASVADNIEVRGRDDGETVVVAAEGPLPTFIPRFSFGRGPSRLELPISVRAEVSKERFRGGR
jgi:TadE-like protein